MPASSHRPPSVGRSLLARRSAISVLALGGVAVAFALPGGAGAATSAYKTPVAGAWKIQDSFESTAGGTVTLAKKGTEIRNLSLNIGADSVDSCGEGTVKVTKALKIKRLGSYKRPAVGKLSKKSGLIETVSTKVSTPAGTVDGQVSILFDKDGKSAFSSKLAFGECTLNFALRRK